MIHRAIYGSLERFTAIITEHYGGKWPFWLSPRQIMVIPVHPSGNAYALELQRVFHDAGFHAEADVGEGTMKYKIRSHQINAWNFTVVVGAEEEKARAVNIRNRDDVDSQSRGEMMSVEEALGRFKKLKESRAKDNKL